MSKVLKPLAVVASIALAIPTGGASGTLLAAALGVSATAAAGIAIGLNLGAGLLAKRPKAPATSPAAADRLFASIDPRTPRKMAFGRTALANDIRDQEFSADQSYLHRFHVCASHKVESIDEIWFDDKLAWTATGGVQGEFVGYLTVATRNEGNAGNAINIGARMGAARRYTGCAYVHLRYKLTGNTKKVESPFAQSVPSRVTIVGKGAWVYDPRLDSTVPGGSGPQRAHDQSTWAWGDSASRNPALIRLWHLLGWRINGMLAVGMGIPPARIDLQSFITAANMCDEAVALNGGGFEPRYRFDGVFSESDGPGLINDNLKASMNAEMDDVDGKLRLLVLHNDLGSPRADLNEGDILADFRWEQTASLEDSFNIVRGTYTDPSANSLYQAVDYPEVAIASPDGIDRIETVNLAGVQSPGQAQRLAKQRVARMLYSGTFTATFSHRAWKVQRGDVVRLSFSPLGWMNKLFRVVETGVRVDGTVPMVLREEHPDIYLWDSNEAPAIQPVQPTSYDPFLNPIYQDLLAIVDDGALDALRAELLARLDNDRTVFVQDTAPSAAESAVNDLWIVKSGANSGRTYLRVAGSGRLAAGGKRIKVGGSYILAPWTELIDSRIAKALLDAAGALAVADGKAKVYSMRNASEAVPVGEHVGDLLVRLYLDPIQIDHWNGSSWITAATYGATAQQALDLEHVVSDGVLSRGEKTAAILNWESVNRAYSENNAKGAALGVAAAERGNAASKISALAGYLSSLSPAWNDTSQDTAIDPTSYKAYWNDAYTANAQLSAAVLGAPLGTPVGTISAGDVSGTIKGGGGVGDNQVGTPAIQNNAVTASVGATSPSMVSTTGAAIEAQIAAVTVTEGGVLVIANGIVSGGNTGPAGFALGSIYITRNGVTIDARQQIGANQQSYTAAIYDNPGPGTHTYRLMIADITAGGGMHNFNMENRTLALVNTRR